MFASTRRLGLQLQQQHQLARLSIHFVSTITVVFTRIVPPYMVWHRSRLYKITSLFLRSLLKIPQPTVILRELYTIFLLMR